MPIFHDCQRCTACCKWPGEVCLTAAELSRLAEYLEMSEATFIERHTKLSSDRRGLALLDKPNGECEFLENDLCRIQPVKPQQCRDFPNLWRYPNAEKLCKAIPMEVSEEEYEKRIFEATGRKPPFPLPPDVN